jgi:hypothetical protein
VLVGDKGERQVRDKGEARGEAFKEGKSVTRHDADTANQGETREAREIRERQVRRKGETRDRQGRGKGAHENQIWAFKH